MSCPRFGAAGRPRARPATACSLASSSSSSLRGAGLLLSPRPAAGQFKSRQLVCVTAQLATKPKLFYAGEARSRAAGPFGIRDPQPNAMVLPRPVMSRSDMAFHDDGFEFVYSTDGLSVAELNQLFVQVGFPRRDELKLQVALANSHSVVWVRCAHHDADTSGIPHQVLGFARAVTGGHPSGGSATIWDVAVNPSYQGRGLGRGLMERLTAMLVEDNINSITLFAEPAVVGLYEKLGYAHCPPNSVVHNIVHHDRLHNTQSQQPAATVPPIGRITVSAAAQLTF